MTGGDAVRLGGPAPGARQTVAVNLNSINRVGDKVELQYFVWPDDKSDYTEITTRIDCSKTGEQIVLARQYDRDFAYVRTSNEAVRRADARARAIATYACGSQRGHGVDGNPCRKSSRAARRSDSLSAELVLSGRAASEL